MVHGTARHQDERLLTRRNVLRVGIAAASSAAAASALAEGADITLVVQSKFPRNRVFQRDTRTGAAFGRGEGAVTFTITASAAGSRLQYRLRDAAVAGQPVLQDWTASAFSTTGVVQQVTQAIPASAHWYLVDWRADAQGRPALGTTPMGIGEVVAVAGQSLAVGMFGQNGISDGGPTKGLVPHIPHLGVCYAPYIENRTAGVPTDWLQPADGGWYDSAGAAELVRLLVGKYGVPAALVGHAVGFTDLAYMSRGGGGYALLHSVLDAVGKVGGFILYEGHNNALEGTSAAEFQSQIAAFYQDMAAHLAGPGSEPGAFVRLVSSIPAVRSWGNCTVEHIEQVRQGAIAYCEADSRAAYVPNLDTVLSGDGTHPNQVGRVVEARNFYREYVRMVGASAGRPAPTIVRATRARHSAQILLTIANSSGRLAALKDVGRTPVAASAAELAAQFQIYMGPLAYDGDGNPRQVLKVASAAITSPSTITLKLNSIPADGVELIASMRMPYDTAEAVGVGVYDEQHDDGLKTGYPLHPPIAPLKVQR